MKRVTVKQQGFTLVELMIATVIFSTILLATMTVLLQVGRIYYKGVITNRTQEVARTINDEISQQLQFGGSAPRTGAERTFDNGVKVNAFCIGNQRYSYVMNAKVSSGALEGQPQTDANGHVLQHALWRDTISPAAPCDPLNLSLRNPNATTGVTQGTSGEELLGQNMRLSSSFAAPRTCNGSLCSFTVSVLYGDDDLLQPDATNPTGCGNIAGSQWCAVSTIRSQVFQRLQQAGS